MSEDLKNPFDLDLDIESSSNNDYEKPAKSSKSLIVDEAQDTEDLLNLEIESTKNELTVKTDEKQPSQPETEEIEKQNKSKEEAAKFIQKSGEQVKDFFKNIFKPVTQQKQGPVISWKEEAIKGNFMPSVIMLEEGKIHVDEIVDMNNENRLIHLAATFSYLNVTRCLIEKFNADINLKNKYGHTALHIIANNTTRDIFLLAYVLNLDQVVINIPDNTEVLPIFYSALSNFHLGFMCLVAKQSAIDHLDKFGNSIMYIIVAYGNLFAYRFMQNHNPNFDLNELFYKGKMTLSDVLINSSHRQICLHVMRDYHNDLSINSIISCNKENANFDSVNIFNKELIQTTLHYRSKSFLKFWVNLIFSFKHKFFMLNFMCYDLILHNMSTIIKYLLLIVYLAVKSYLFWVFFLEFLSMNGNENFKSLISKQTLVILYQLSSFVLVLFALMRFIFGCCFGNRQHVMKKKQILYSEDNENIVNQINKALESEIVSIPMEEEICEVCLIKKKENVHHCSTCNNCIEGFHFHSKLLGCCISNSNVFYYIMLLNSIIAINLSIVYFLYFIMDYRTTMQYRKSGHISLDQNNSKSTIYDSDYFLFNIGIFISSLSWSNLFFVLYLISLSALLGQVTVCLILCLGYKSTYYLAFRMHRPHIGMLQMRENHTTTCQVPIGPQVGCREFAFNMFYLSNE